MSMTPEGRVKAIVKKYLREIGAYYYMPVQNGMGVVGVPDFIVCLGGRFIAIETKAPGKEATVTANQQRQMDAIKKAGGDAYVVTSLDDMIVLHTVARLEESNA